MAHGRGVGRWFGGFGMRHVALIVIVCAVGYFGSVAASNTVSRHDLDRSRAGLERDIRTLEAQQRRLEALRSYMQTDEFIERAARDEGLVKPGDTAVVVAAAPQPPAPAAGATPGPWWERYFGAPRSR